MSRQLVKGILGSSGVVGAIGLAWVLGSSPPKIAATDRVTASEPDQSDGTRRMVERLAQLAENPPGINKFESGRILERLRSLPLPTDPRERVLYNIEFGSELLNNGQTSEAAERLQALWELLETQGRADQEGPLRAEVHSLLAIAQLRLGEQGNCIEHHGMTVGEHPDRVPAQWLIPPQVFESDYDIQRFYDISSEAGVDVEGRAGGAILDDFDGDGFLDLFVSSQGPSDQIRFFRNARNGTFEERTREAGLTGLNGGLNIVHADYDNDGDLDVYVLRGAWLHEAGRIPDSLLRNNGDGTFEDVTEEAGMLAYHPSQAGAWGDYDNDGWVDLFITNESTRLDPHPCELYHNNGDGTFDNVADVAGVAAVAYVQPAVVVVVEEPTGSVVSDLVFRLQ